MSFDGPSRLSQPRLRVINNRHQKSPAGLSGKEAVTFFEKKVTKKTFIPRGFCAAVVWPLKRRQASGNEQAPSLTTFLRS